MRVIGFAGWSGAGKTTLIVKLIPELNRRGFSVSTIKHAHHNFDLDQPGKDSHAHRSAGAHEVLVASANRIALMRELRGAPEPSLPELLRLLEPVDLVMIEGFKRDPYPKIEVFRASQQQAADAPGRPAHRRADRRSGGDVGASAARLDRRHRRRRGPRARPRQGARRSSRCVLERAVIGWNRAPVIASAAKQSIHRTMLLPAMDGLLRRRAPRNDGLVPSGRGRL